MQFKSRCFPWKTNRYSTEKSVPKSMPLAASHYYVHLDLKTFSEQEQVIFGLMMLMCLWGFSQGFGQNQLNIWQYHGDGPVWPASGKDVTADKSRTSRFSERKDADIF